MSQKRSFHMLFQFRVTPLTPPHSKGDVTERRNAISNNGLLVRAITDILFYTDLIRTMIEIN